ncbi:MAG TPA: MBL fold metallo-hydrolase [Xanthomonadales bacterium]|nr:MBL fold metallo-hydrolase [Xanthomonadales bacterium]
MDRLLFLIITAMLCTQGHAHDNSSQATYLGNEGVMVARGDTRILFDAFYSDSYSRYTLVPKEIAEAMLAGEAPYDGIDAIFVSHVHGDHFTAGPAVTYLRAHPQVQLYGTEQIREAIIDIGVAANDPLFERIHTYSIEPEDKPIEFSLDGLLVEAVAIPHSGGEQMADIDNLAWRVTLDAMTTVIHLGDAGPIIADFERHQSFFEKRKSHAAFVPYWLYLDETGVSIIENIIAADQAIGVHVPASAIGKGDETREQLGADAFTDPGETRRIEGSK